MVIIYGNQPPNYSAMPGQVQQGDQAVSAAAPIAPIGLERPSERRLKPDRRQHQQPWDASERRKRRRRSPLLLNARSSKPEPLGPSKGLLIDTRV
jgi:hypothetical protein